MQYFSIFLPNVIHFEKTDSEVIRNARITNFSAVTILFLVEHVLISSPDEASVYLILANKNPKDGIQGLPITTKFLIFLVILSICILQYQLEKTGMKEQSINKQIIRIVSIIVILVVSYIMKYLENLNFSSRLPLLYMTSGVMTSIFFCVFPPTLFLVSHYRLRKYASSLFQLLISKCLSNIFQRNVIYDVVV